MKYFLLISCCTLAAFGSHRVPSITITHPPDSTLRAAFHFVDSVFARKTFLFQTLEPDIPADMQSAIIRYTRAIAANQQWYLDYRNKYSTSGQPLPYNEHFGITPEEYRRIQHLETMPSQLTAVDSQQVAVSRDHGFIQLKSDGQTHLLDYLTIDSSQELLIYGGDTIPFAGRSGSGPSSPYGQWQGFTWRLERTDIASTLDANKVTARIIELNLGLPSEGGKTFLRIKYQDVSAGATTANMELLGYIR